MSIIRTNRAIMITNIPRATIMASMRMVLATTPGTHMAAVRKTRLLPIQA